MALRRQLCVLLLVLLAVDFSASPVATQNCYETVKGVPQRCSGEFITALFATKRRWISRECCQQLLCVREQSCFNAIRDYCVPPQAWQQNCF
uniref:Prolamin-like domain-containing protein n=2 Tax=Aegilops tauschii TaxID=37682 RepID=A0A453GQL3_AEGTS